MHHQSSATATFSFELPEVPGFRQGQDEFLDVTNPKHPCYSGHQHIWRQDERKWRCTRCGQPDMTGRPAPTMPHQPMYPPPRTYPMPVLPMTPGPGPAIPLGPYEPPTVPMLPGRIDVTYTSDRSVGQGCLWDQLSPEDRGKPMGLSCPCPRCSPRC